MASISATCLITFQPLFNQYPNKTSQAAASLKLVSVGKWAKKSTTGVPSLRASRFRVSCAAKPETLKKIWEVVREQLPLTSETELPNDSPLLALGSNSLDKVEILMELEEEFGVTMSNEGFLNITTVQEAADMIEKLVEKKAEGEN